MNRLTQWILVSMVAGIVVGSAVHVYAPGPEAAKDIAGWFGIVTEVFLRLIKMIIAPLVFSTLVAGLAGIQDSNTIGRLGARALGWFVGASSCSLAIGLGMANLLQPGANLNVPLPVAGAASSLKTESLNLKDFLTHVFPRSLFEALAGNEILQILIFALFFGIALGRVNKERASPLLRFFEDIVRVMLQATDYVMRFAPLGVFAAVAGSVATQGLGILLVYGKYMGSFYLGLAVLWLLLVLVAWLALGTSVWRLLGLIRGPMLVGFSTASSESAYPRLMEQLTRFGVREGVTGFVLPLGYSFNLDGSMMYTTFAALFIAQAYDVPLTLGEQVTMLLVLMVSSKGIAGVPRASLVVVAAVLPMFHLPEAGLLLVLGVDHFMDMGRTVTNVLGNAIATTVVASWEGAIDAPASEPAG